MGAGMWFIVVAVVLLAVAGVIVVARRPSGGATTSEKDCSNPHLGEAGRPPSDLGGGGMV